MHTSYHPRPDTPPEEEPLRWAEFIDHHQRRRGAAKSAAAALSSGDPRPALALLSGWRFAGAEQLAAPLLAALSGGAPRYAETAPLSHTEGDPDLAEYLHRQRLAVAGGGELADCLEALAFLGGEVERRERASWRAQRYLPDPEADAEIGGLWAAWFSGNPWGIRDAWEALLLPAISEVFSAVMEARSVPREVRRAAIEDAREGFFYLMLGGEESTPGWRELAVRTLECAPEGPLDGVTPHPRPGTWDLVARCAVRRGHLETSAAALWPDRPGAEARARALRRTLADDPGAAEAMLDLHAALRVLDRWSTGAHDPAGDWRVVIQNRGRSRGRIRAALTSDPASIQEPLLRLDALAARTRAAVKRMAWAWARQQLGRGLTFDALAGVTPPCQQPPEGLAPLDDDERAALESWVMLVVFKGRLGHLRRWSRTGGTGDTDSTWGRLLKDDLPAALRDPGGGRNASYHRVRTALCEDLEALLEAQLPALQALLALPGGKGLRGRFEGLLMDGWSPTVPFPKSGFPTFHSNIADALESLSRDWEAP